MCFSNKDFLGLPLCFLYRIAYKVHHLLFLRPQKPLKHSQLVVIGSVLTGGAGKTPFTIWLSNYLVNLFGIKLAVLCHSMAQDEYKLLKCKILGATIFATNNRYKTAKELDGQFDIILCDDGFEDSRLIPDLVIRLDWGKVDNKIKNLWPIGNYRSLPKDYLIKSKDMIFQCQGELKDIDFVVSEIKNAEGEIFENSSLFKVAVVCGIGNPMRFVNDLKNLGIIFERVIVRPDHDKNFCTVVKKTLNEFDKIIMTEKDFMRLDDFLQKGSKLFFCKQEVLISPQKISEIKESFRRKTKEIFNSQLSTKI